MNVLQSLAHALGGTVSGAQVLCPGPGHSPQDRSLSVTPSAAAPDGFIVYSHAGDDWRDCRDLVMARLGHARRQYKRPVIDRSAPAVALWDSAQDPGSIIERYLSGRGLQLPDDVAGRVVRFHPRCPWRDGGGAVGRRTAMLTAFRSIADDRLVAVHRTLLADDGSKIDRRMLGPVGGAAIKIDRDEDVEHGLAVGEGFETGLAGRVLGFRPVWALGSAGAIAAMPVLSGIDALTILAETDDSGANARAVQACGKRWFDAGREVILVTPNIIGDLNDTVLT
jgi:putative DNA primase/helicase